MSPPLDIAFYVQHLLGIGHMTRAATLIRAMRRHGLSAAMISGGETVPGLDLGDAPLYQLEPLRADGIEFTQLLDANGRIADEALKQRRRARLLELWQHLQPRLLLIEMYPFGRRQLRFELLPLIDAARLDGARIVSSVRDVLVSAPKPARVDEMVELVKTRFDLVLVHGDPALIPFADTFPPARLIEGKLRYTGYVIDERARPDGRAAQTPKGEILVSTGGGRVSKRLVDAALAARGLLRAQGREELKARPWRVLIGPHLPQAEFEAYRRQREAGLVIERARPDFTALLGSAALSISQGGYNTVMECFAAGCPRVIVPYRGGGENEQTVRGSILARKGWLTLVDEAELDGQKLASAMEAEWVRAGQRAALNFNDNGADMSAAYLARVLRQVPD